MVNIYIPYISCCTEEIGMKKSGEIKKYFCSTLGGISVTSKNKKRERQGGCRRDRGGEGVYDFQNRDEGGGCIYVSKFTSFGLINIIF